MENPVQNVDNFLYLKRISRPEPAERGRQMDKKVSQAVIRRMPKYYTHLKELQSQGVAKISSRDLGQQMGLTASQVRQDFNCFGGFGQQGYGYPVDGLIESISEILGLGRQKTVILIGVGNLGRALMNNFNYFQNGFELIAAFDRAPAIIGTTQQGTVVRDVAGLREFCLQNHPDVAVLTIPRESVHETAGLLIDCGIKGIWNFTNIELNLGLGVKVENVHLAESLMVLSYMLGEGKASAQ